jgi:hypothetical protein
MQRRISEIDIVGDDRTIEKQCISYIWLHKLIGEQTRRYKESCDDDVFAEELDLDCYDDNGDEMIPLDIHW